MSSFCCNNSNNLSENELKFLNALNHFPKFGSAKLKKLLKFFGSAENAFKGSLKHFIEAKIEDTIAQEFIQTRSKINPDEKWEQICKEKIKIVTIDNNDYPYLLKQIPSPPYLLYYRGQLNKKENYPIAVVGSRKCSSYGKQVTEQIVKELASKKITIISGLALGIDSFAHSTALSVGGRTLAVLGTGIDQKSIYPKSNSHTAEKIIDSDGAVISEFPPQTPPLKYNFPQRNRIIAGLSLGVLVIEAGEKSGALITANFALDFNRDVFAVPGNIFSKSSLGTNKLLKQGAIVVTNAEDIAETLGIEQKNCYINNKEITPETKEEEQIINLLGYEPTDVNTIIRSTGLDTGMVNSTLSIMEMKGMIKNVGGMEYIKI